MVQFGRKLKNNRTSHWEREYVDYSALKKLIRKLVARHAALESRVSNERTALLTVGDNSNSNGNAASSMDDDLDAPPSFRATLEREIGKVEQFYEAKLAEYRRQLEYFDEMARPQFDEEDEDAADEDAEDAAPKIVQHSLNSDVPPASPSSMLTSSSSSSALQRLSQAFRARPPSARDERARARADAQRLADKRRRAWIELARQLYLLVNYTQLNYTAVIKIVKKYVKTVPGAEPLDKQALLKGALFVEAQRAARHHRSSCSARSPPSTTTATCASPTTRCSRSRASTSTGTSSATAFSLAPASRSACG
jgi:SPX domain protein involved in polyphosphate accumulation